MPSKEQITASITSMRKRLFDSRLSSPETTHYGQMLDVAAPLQNGHADDISAIGRAIGTLTVGLVGHALDHKDEDAAFDERAEKAAERAFTSVLGSVKNGAVQIQQIADNSHKIKITYIASGAIVLSAVLSSLCFSGKADVVASLVTRWFGYHSSPQVERAE